MGGQAQGAVLAGGVRALLEEAVPVFQAGGVHGPRRTGQTPPAEKNKKEGEGILAKLKKDDVPIILDEHGDKMTSRELAKQVRRWTDAPNRRPVFIIGGPFGLSDEVKAAAKGAIRLSDMTLPHELARLVLLEQLYRAGTILRNMPYHHD